MDAILISGDCEERSTGARSSASFVPLLALFEQLIFVYEAIHNCGPLDIRRGRSSVCSHKAMTTRPDHGEE